MNSKIILSEAAAALLCSSCRKSENGTPDTRAVLTYEMKVTDPSAATNGKVAEDGNIQWKAGFAYPRETRFEAKSDGSGDQTANFLSVDTSRVDLFARIG